MKKIKMNESPIKTQIRRLLKEGEMERSESALAAKDLVDRLQDTVVELGKMSNDELPHLIDSIRSSFGNDAATQYQQTADGVLTQLLDTVKEKKAELENATLVLTGDATAASPAENLSLPDESESNDFSISDEDMDDQDADLRGPKSTSSKKNPLGRETRGPAQESRRVNGKRIVEDSGFKPADSNGWRACKKCNNKGCKACKDQGGKWQKSANANKKIREAKIVAVNKALKETNAKKMPIKARRLAEALRQLVTEALKDDAKAAANKKNLEQYPCNACGVKAGVKCKGNPAFGVHFSRGQKKELA